MPEGSVTVELEARVEEVLRESDGHMLCLIEIWAHSSRAGWKPGLIHMMVCDPRLDESG